MPIDPAPAPTSQSSSSGRGIRWANADARTSRLVSCPSCSYASSGRPVASVAKGAGPATSTQTTFRAGASAGLECRVSSAPPRLPSTVSVLAEWPAWASSAATSAGLAASRDRMINRCPGNSQRRIWSTSSPRSRITSTDSAAQPIRARARATEDTAGWIRTASGPNSSIKVEPTPASSGSPLASTTVVRAACPDSSSGSAARRSAGQTSRR